MTPEEQNNIHQDSKTNQAPEKNLFKVKIQPNAEVNLSEQKKKTIIIWEIIGAVLVPLIPLIGYSIMDFSGTVFLFLLLYLITIPLAYGTVKAVKTSKNRLTLQRFAGLSALFCSLPAGLMLLSELIKVDRAYQAGQTTTPSSKPEPAPKVEAVIPVVKEKPKPIEPKTISIEPPKKEIPVDPNRLQYQELQNTIKRYELYHRLDDLKKVTEIAGDLSLKGYEDSQQIYEKYQPLLAAKMEEKAASRKKMGKKIGVFALVGVLLIAVIVPTAILVPNAIKTKRYQAVYEEVRALLDDYDDANYEQIKSLINDLEGSDYDTRALKGEMNNHHYYVKLIDTIGNYYKTREDTDWTIEDYLDQISDDNFKKVAQIKADFEMVRAYKTYIITEPSSTADATVYDYEANQNRTYLKKIYRDANTSGLWNFDYFLHDLAVPYLICNAEFANADYSFKWYKGGTEGQITAALPMPFTYTSSDSVYFETVFTGAGYKYDTGLEKYANQMQFNLIKNGYTYQWFCIKEVSYRKTDEKFICKILLNTDNSTHTLVEV